MTYLFQNVYLWTHRQDRCIQSEPSVLEPADNGSLSEWKLEDHYAGRRRIS